MALYHRHLKNLQPALTARAPNLVQTKGRKDMPNDDFIVVCPFYHKALGNDLFCEGISADDNFLLDKSMFKQSFADRKSRNECMLRYCTSFKYKECRLAALNSYLKNY